MSVSIDDPGLDQPRRARLDVILSDIDVRLTTSRRTALSTDELYDDDGLPG